MGAQFRYAAELEKIWSAVFNQILRRHRHYTAMVTWIDHPYPLAK